MGGCIYRTKQGDMWDYIAWLIYGDESYVSTLYRANPKYFDVYLFADGCEIYCPEIAASDEEDENIPDWRDNENLEEELPDDSGEAGEDGEDNENIY